MTMQDKERTDGMHQLFLDLHQKGAKEFGRSWLFYNDLVTRAIEGTTSVWADHLTDFEKVLIAIAIYFVLHRERKSHVTPTTE